ncbi:site-specific integrase [Glaciimonas soli]|uniref:Tyrosine-type recombinase/integrase n=1 Tax=Glaciimonas soli TaxID=2590999 RepID=A0A843YX94_9BURK|nr:site-specific integrase [Glaciimonas soli]MQR02353.1 tyrosine-type recombinase/integrase [Glaciimonas soli]
MARIRKRGTSKYQARVRIKGYPEVARTFSSNAAAVLWAAQREQQLLQGLGEALKEADALPLSVALTRYAETVTPRKKSAHSELNRIKVWLRQPLASLTLSSIRGKHLAEYRDSRILASASGNTIRLELAVISHLYEVARKDWGLEHLVNPVKVIHKPKLPRGRTRRLYNGEELALLNWCEQNENLRLKYIVIIAIETAMRRGELAGLTWQDVNLSTRMIYLDDTKNGESRTIPLSSRALGAFKALEDIKDTRTITSATASQNSSKSEIPIFNLHVDNISAEFLAARRGCHIEGLTFHDLRHEATSRLFEKGFNMMEVATITGHKSMQMLKRYTHLRPADLLARLG